MSCWIFRNNSGRCREWGQWLDEGCPTVAHSLTILFVLQWGHRLSPVCTIFRWNRKKSWSMCVESKETHCRRCCGTKMASGYNLPEKLGYTQKSKWGYQIVCACTRLSTYSWTLKWQRRIWACYYYYYYYFKIILAC